MRSRIHPCLIVQPIRHIPNSHVISDGISIAGIIDNGIEARDKCYLRSPSFAKEFSIDVYAFAVDLFNVLSGIRWVARVKVPADTELVADIELDFLTFEGVVDRFGDVALESGYVAVLHARDPRFADHKVNTRLAIYALNRTYDLGNVVVTSIRLLADSRISGPPIA